MSAQCPLFPRKRTFLGTVVMSALSQKRTSLSERSPPVVTIKQRKRDRPIHEAGPFHFGPTARVAGYLAPQKLAGSDVSPRRLPVLLPLKITPAHFGSAGS